MPKRTANPHRKDRCVRAHARTERTKAARRATAEAQHAGNLILIKAGELTPWEAACKLRAQRRAKPSTAAHAGRVGGQS